MDRDDLLGIQTADGDGGHKCRHSDEDSDDEDENLDPVNPGSCSDLGTSLHIVDGVLREDSLQFPVSLVIKQLVDNIQVHDILVTVQNLKVTS